jgi:hypothetical protein
MICCWGCAGSSASALISSGPFVSPRLWLGSWDAWDIVGSLLCAKDIASQTLCGPADSRGLVFDGRDTGVVVRLRSVEQCYQDGWKLQEEGHLMYGEHGRAIKGASVLARREREWSKHFDLYWAGST